MGQLDTQPSINEVFSQINDLLHNMKSKEKKLIIEDNSLVNEEITRNYDVSLSHNFKHYNHN